MTENASESPERKAAREIADKWIGGNVFAEHELVVIILQATEERTRELRELVKLAKPIMARHDEFLFVAFEKIDSWTHDWLARAAEALKEK